MDEEHKKEIKEEIMQEENAETEIVENDLSIEDLEDVKYMALTSKTTEEEPTTLNNETLLSFKKSVELLKIVKTSLAIKRDEFEKANEELISSIKALGEKLLFEETNIRFLAKKEYLETGSKKLLGGLGVRVSQSLIYADVDAFNWSKRHDLFLQLDKKAFEKYAQSQELAFVNKEERVIVTIPKTIVIEK